MDPLGATIGILISATLFVAACYFIWRQWLLLTALQADVSMPREQRLFLQAQCKRRNFGAGMLVALAFMLCGSVFLDYDPQNMSPDNLPQADPTAAKDSLRFLSFYLMTMLLILMAIVMLAVLDFWAIARYGVQQQKQLAKEHQELLAADLAAHKQRHSP